MHYFISCLFIVILGSAHAQSAEEKIAGAFCTCANPELRDSLIAVLPARDEDLDKATYDRIDSFFWDAKRCSKGTVTLSEEERRGKISEEGIQIAMDKSCPKVGRLIALYHSTYFKEE